MADGGQTPTCWATRCNRAIMRGPTDSRQTWYSSTGLLIAWLPLLALPAAAIALTPANWPRWAFMWTLAIAIYVGCKWLTWRRACFTKAPRWKHIAYLLAWPGLDAPTFLKPANPRELQKPCAAEWRWALAKLTIGLAVMFGLARQLPPEHPYLMGWVGMVGIVMTLHFGLFHLLSCVWRSAGALARPLMCSPALSTSVSEFWGRRWNTAFRDLTHRFLFRPLTPWFGARGAIFVGFVFSGLVHDLVISLPAGGGYGGPTLFFLLQGTALFVERSSVGRKVGLGSGAAGWLFTALVLVGPAYLLFHPPFVVGIVVPFMNALGAIG